MSAEGAHSAGVDVVIVAHNSGDLLAEAVRSAAAQVGQERVWVIDAESTDGAPQSVAEEFSAMHVIAAPNAGFSASNNRGIEATNGEFVLLLNPDAALEPGAVAALLRVAGDEPRAGIVGALVLNPDGSPQANQFGRFPTLATQLALRLWRVGQRIAGNDALSPRVPERATRVDWVTGAVMLVRRSAIEDAGAMDEAFFLYYEDVEWCHRMADHGWRALVAPGARVVHHLGSSGASVGTAVGAYRESFYRYCDLYGLWGLKSFASLGLWARSAIGGRS